MTARNPRVAVAALVLALAAGCGGDEGSSRGEERADRLTRAQYIERGDALCREIMGYLDGEFAAEFELLDRAAARSGDPARFSGRYAALLEEAADRTARHIERFAALRPPAESQETHAAIVRALRAQQYLARREVNAYRDGRPELADALLNRIEAIDEEIEAVVREYGFVDCARPG